MTDGFKIFDMPPIPREPFKSDEDYERAVATSQSAQYDQPYSTVFIPEEMLVDFTVFLINHTPAIGMGVLHDRDADRAEVESLLDELRPHGDITLDYINGRPIKAKPFKKVDGGYEWETDLYNRLGAHAGEKVWSDFMAERTP